GSCSRGRHRRSSRTAGTGRAVSARCAALARSRREKRSPRSPPARAECTDRRRIRCGRPAICRGCSCSTRHSKRSLAAAALALGRLVDAPVDLGDLLDPRVALLVLHREDVVHAPVKVVRDVGYLAGELVQRVAYDSPSAVAPVPMSTWKSLPQLGHLAATFAVPLSLICR